MKLKYVFAILAMLLIASSGCYAAVPEKIKLAYTVYHQGQHEINKNNPLVSQGINAFIIYGIYANDSDQPDKIQTIKDYARWAKENNVMNFVNLNFVHWFDSDEDASNGCNGQSAWADNRVVYSDGRLGCLVSPWDEKYWAHLTELVKNLAAYANNCSDCRIDGVHFDFELYYHELYDEPISLDKSMGFEDHIFQKFIDNCADCPSPAPTGALQRADRHGWLNTNGKLEGYYSFLKQEIKLLAVKMRTDVNSVNPNFLISAYPSPVRDYREYLASVYSGWSSRQQPMIIAGTEMYYDGGAEKIPANLNGNKIDASPPYYNLAGVYGEEIFAYYIGGMINYIYSPTDWAFNLYEVAKNSNGYWIYTTFNITADFEYLTRSYPDYRLKCFDSVTNCVRTCEASEEYQDIVDIHYQQMGAANSELDKYVADNSYVSTLRKSSDDPMLYECPAMPDLDFGVLYPVKKQEGELSLEDKKLRFRMSQHNFITRAEKDKSVAIEIESNKTGVFEGGSTYLVIDSEGNEITNGRVQPNSSKTISFTAPKTGNFVILINPGKNAFLITKTNVPIAAYSKSTIHLLGFNRSTTDLYFWVNDTISNFKIDFKGGGGEEGLTATIFKPTTGSYTAVASDSTTETQNSFSLSTTVPPDATKKIWKLEITNPPSGIVDDVYITFDSKIEPFFGLTDNESYFMIRCQQTNNGIEACDSIDNDCDNEIDEDNICTQECIDTPKLTGFISQWKRGEISMLTLMQKMRQWKTGTGCPPA